MIHTGDCIEVMAGMEAESVDAVVTDPPYGIGFMGKTWDAFDQNAVEASWSAKGRNHTSERNPDASTPGGRSTTRTGFRETNPRCGTCGRVTKGRDTLKGFKVCHCKNPVIVGTPNRDAQRFQAWCEAWGREALRVTRPGGYLLAFGGCRTHHRLVCGLEDAGWIIRDELDWIYASGFPKGRANLKPAHEPIVLARKPGPLRPLGIDACRITTADDRRRDRAGMPSDGGEQEVFGTVRPRGAYEPQGVGRWPSNVLLDPDSAALFDEPNPEVVGSDDGMFGLGAGSRRDNSYASDTGGYSRFFLIPKSSRGDREPVLRGQLEATQNSQRYGSIQDGRSSSGEPYDREAAWSDNVYCNCETDKPEWVSEGQRPQGRTASTLRARATSEETSTDGFDWPTLPSGSEPLDPSHQDGRSTTSTETSRTTGSPTSSSSTPSLTSGSTLGASLSTDTGGNGVPSAKPIGRSSVHGGTSARKAGRSTVDADPATSPASSTTSVCGDCGKLLRSAAVGGADGVTRAARRNSHPT